MILENVLSRPDIDRALDVLSKLEWKEGFSRFDEYKREVKRNLELRQSDDVGVKIVGQEIQKKLWNNVEFTTVAFPYKAASLRFNKCANGGFYGAHADASVMANPPIRSDLSCTIWLSDDYEGGELVIDGESFKGKAGDAILYPSYSVHEVKPVTSGERICAIIWIQSMVRDQAKRELLTRFHRMGEKMKEKENLSPDYIEMTSIYNNLLRLWVEV